MKYRRVAILVSRDLSSLIFVCDAHLFLYQDKAARVNFSCRINNSSLSKRPIHLLFTLQNRFFFSFKTPSRVSKTNFATKNPSAIQTVLSNSFSANHLIII